jgi:hypothetical protein
MQGQNNNFVAQIILAWPRLHFIILLYRKRGEKNRGGILWMSSMNTQMYFSLCSSQHKIEEHKYLLKNFGGTNVFFFFFIIGSTKIPF